jgi:hypothetical protein
MAVKGNKTPNGITSKGVVLISFGKEIYHQSTQILIESIRKHNSTVPIAVITDKPTSAMFENANEIIELERTMYHSMHGKFEPGKAKLAVYPLLPYDENLILDVDSYCLKDIAPLIERLSASWKPYQTHMSGYVKQGDKASQQALQWARMEDIYEKYKIPTTRAIPAINSSIVYVKKCEEAASIYDTALTLIEHYPFKQSELMYKWGGAQPDELYMNASLAMHDYDPAMEQVAMFFGHGHNKQMPQVMEEFYFLSYYGGNGFTHSYYINWIQGQVRNSLGMRINLQTILYQKHANTRSN